MKHEPRPPVLSQSKGKGVGVAATLPRPPQPLGYNVALAPMRLLFEGKTRVLRPTSAVNLGGSQDFSCRYPFGAVTPNESSHDVELFERWCERSVA